MPGIPSVVTFKTIYFENIDLSFKKSIYSLKNILLFKREREREHRHGGGAEGEGDADSLLSLTWGLIPGPGDHDLSQRQTLK